MSRPRGHVTQRGRKWSVVICVADEATGKRKLHWHSGYTSKREAEKAKSKLLHDLDNESYSGPSTMSVDAFLRKRWLPTAERTVRPTTYKLYEVMVNAYITPRIGGKRLQKVGPADLDHLYIALEKGGRKNGAGLSKKTVANVHGMLWKAFDYAVKVGLRSTNPTRLADAPRPGRSTKPRVWTRHQLGAFFKSVEGDRLQPAYELAVATGLRRSELLGLTWDNVTLKPVNPQKPNLAVVKTLVEVGTVLTLVDETKTKHSRRLVELAPETVDMLREHRKRQTVEQAEWGEAYEKHGLVFAQENGALLKPSEFTRRFQKLCRSAGVPAVGIHGLRHTAATLMLEAGVNVKVVAERLRHASVTATLDVYSHVLPSMETDAAATLAAVIHASR